jgi:outer membrane protein assembly factor BamB
MGARRSFLVLAAMGLLLSCKTAHQTMASYLAEQRSSRSEAGATERVFSINWWTRADQSFGLPYRPVEPGEPELDEQTGRVFVGTGDGKVRAFDSRGRFLWEYEVQSTFDAGPTLSGGRLFVAASKGQLVALEAATGKKVWEYDASEELITKPVVAEGLVLVMSTADTLYAIDEAKGDWRWQYRRDQPSDFTVRGASRPAVSEGRVFAGFADGFAVSLDLKDGTLQWAKDLGGGKAFADVDAGPVVDSQKRV